MFESARSRLWMRPEEERVFDLGIRCFEHLLRYIFQVERYQIKYRSMEKAKWRQTAGYGTES